MTPTITDPQRHVFVYGTLRRGQLRDINFLHPAPVFVGTAQVNGTLYHLGNYPGVRLGGTNSVKGEIYLIASQLERQLDEIEEVLPNPSGEYERCEVGVNFSGKILTCLIYEIAETRTNGAAIIESGDWATQ